MIARLAGSQRRWCRRQWVMIGAASVIAALLLVGGYVVWIFQPLDAHSRGFEYIRVRPGQTANEVAVTLKSRGIIKSAWAFVIMSRIDGAATSLSSGVYRLSPRESLGNILKRMKSGQVVVTKVSIPEGFTVKQIVDRLVSNHIGTPEQYRRLEKQALPGMPRPRPGVRDPLEGYLFPATYSFEYGTTARQALTEMWKTFQTRMIVGLYDKSHTGLSLVDWVTLASIVQQESKQPGQDAAVASVFLNRLKQNMPFQSDATVRYALGRVPAGGLVAADLTNPSPYNTYAHKGFPPGPIANPGEFTLKAALFPAHQPYLYFVSLRSGHILFARTFQGQLRNIRYAQNHPHA